MTMYAGPERRFDTDIGPELLEKVVHIRRVAKVVKGGRHLSFNAMVVVGDGQGRVGIGMGKGTAVPDAVRKGNTIARKNMIAVPMKGSTIPHQITATFGGSRVLVKPASPGAGVIAGGPVRAVMEAAGIKDVVAKNLGSRNPINVVKAALEGLSHLQGEINQGPVGAPAVARPLRQQRVSRTAPPRTRRAAPAAPAPALEPPVPAVEPESQAVAETESTVETAIVTTEAVAEEVTTPAEEVVEASDSVAPEPEAEEPAEVEAPAAEAAPEEESAPAEESVEQETPTAEASPASESTEETKEGEAEDGKTKD